MRRKIAGAFSAADKGRRWPSSPLNESGSFVEQLPEGNKMRTMDECKKGIHVRAVGELSRYKGCGLPV
jgi:hypothetical protein